ncbi:(2Fe-2S) ferredoxin domain-containing protein [Labilibacter marinus]|uniref:(2Fe-2S) ferredoxin domain-containing protein n=1 Tax=Labilibacter marinus TaxID=1477105 RepID=UPI00094F9363|nr:NAD(P)H-dependent oxidoreductase subunit E [Labilibacter marinus]
MDKTQEKAKIRICLGSSCYTRGNAENLKIIQAFVEDKQINASIDFRGHLCNENCNKGPVININGVSYEEVQAFQIEKILEETLI